MSSYNRRQRKSRSRSPVWKPRDNNGRVLESSSLEPMRFKKESFGRYQGGRNSYGYNDDRHRPTYGENWRRPMNFREGHRSTYDEDRHRPMHDDYERRPMNRHERRAHLQEEEYSSPQKPMIILDDPSRVPRGTYFEHDRRENAPTGGKLFGGGRSNMRSDEIVSKKEHDQETSRGDDDNDRRRRSGSNNRQEGRSDYYGYRNDPFENPRRSNYNDRNRTTRHQHHDDRRDRNYRSNQHDDRQSFNSHQQQRRESSPNVWKHDKFEELEEKETTTK